MAESADAQDLKSCARKGIRVQFPSPAPYLQGRKVLSPRLSRSFDFRFRPCSFAFRQKPQLFCHNLSALTHHAFLFTRGTLAGGSFGKTLSCVHRRIKACFVKQWRRYLLSMALRGLIGQVREIIGRPVRVHTIGEQETVLTRWETTRIEMVFLKHG